MPRTNQDSQDQWFAYQAAMHRFAVSRKSVGYPSFASSIAAFESKPAALTINKWMRAQESDYSDRSVSRNFELMKHGIYWHPRPGPLPPQIWLAQILSRKLLMDEREVSERGSHCKPSLQVKETNCEAHTNF